MYQKPIHQRSPAKHEQPFSIRLEPIPFDEKAAYVHSVCATLIDSRFDIGKYEDMVFELGECLRRGAVDHDALFMDHPLPWYAGFLDPATATLGSTADANLYAPVSGGPPSGRPRGQPFLVSNLGRGSPNQRFAVFAALQLCVIKPVFSRKAAKDAQT